MFHHLPFRGHVRPQVQPALVIARPALLLLWALTLSVATAVCPEGTHGLDDESCIPCPDGQQSDQFRKECVPCAQDSAGTLGKCRQCPTNQVPNEARTACQPRSYFGLETSVFQTFLQVFGGVIVTAIVGAIGYILKKCCEEPKYQHLRSHPPRMYNVKRIDSADFVQRPELVKWRDDFLKQVKSQKGSFSGVVAAQGFVGVAGLGKTTAMAWLMHQRRVQAAFPDGIFWLQFSEVQGPLERLQNLALFLKIELKENDKQSDIQSKLQTELQGKQCLIGLDDVWNEEQVKPFEKLVGGRIGMIITTRKQDIAASFCGERHLFSLDYMTREQAKEVLRLSLRDTLALKTSGPELDELLKMCSGLPAMLRSIGATLNRYEGKVGLVLKCLKALKLEGRFSEALVAKAKEYDHDGYFFKALTVQLDHLPPDAQQCCKMLSVFAEDASIPFDELQGFWDRDGELEAEEMVGLLARQHLVQADQNRRAISLIDAVRDFLGCQPKSEDLRKWHAKLLACTRVERVPEVNGYWTEAHFAEHLEGCAAGEAVEVAPAPLLPQLKTLAMRSPPTATAFFKVVHGNASKNGNASLNSLTGLDLSFNQIGDEGMLAVSKALSDASLNSLQELWLTDNQIGDKGMLAFSKALSNASLNSLQQLWLSFNQIGDEGMLAFSEALPNASLNSLQVLSLTGNQIGDKGMLAFSEALSNASLNSLKTLWLRNNQIGDRGMTAFAKALSNASLNSLQRIWLGNNKASPESWAALRRACGRKGISLGI